MIAWKIPSTPVDGTRQSGSVNQITPFLFHFWGILFHFSCIRVFTLEQDYFRQNNKLQRLFQLFHLFDARSKIYFGRLLPFDTFNVPLRARVYYLWN